MLLQGKPMPKSHSTNDLITALVVVRMTPKHQTNSPAGLRSPLFSWSGHHFSHRSFISIIFTNLYQRAASWPELLFPKCSGLDCSILNPFSKCVFVLSRMVGKTHPPYHSKETL